MQNFLISRKAVGVALDALEKREETAEVFKRVYMHVAVCDINGYEEERRKGVECLKRIYKKRRGEGLFLSGEFLEELKEELHRELPNETMHTDKEFVKAVLGVRIRKREADEVLSKKAFTELEPFICKKKIVERKTATQERKRIRKARDEAQKVSREQMHRKRKEDQEYAREMERLTWEIKKQ
ncbi:hypothetical protein NEFER03_0936 [Nematocida sp. LUAm3]|nr:hypothetical protein NEFER03_0936 [Nematocida sp. LUAm3]KAI5174954.1 hypothetical protein NEFER02_1054 [Nematocida sp. LUAm2]KAI5177447.1 hypothetical protein NEFER01_0697 [Nematocida sp. LUAm1]